jgi:hypothetical protein
MVQPVLLVAVNVTSNPVGVLITLFPETVPAELVTVTAFEVKLRLYVNKSALQVVVPTLSVGNELIVTTPDAVLKTDEDYEAMLS